MTDADRGPILFIVPARGGSAGLPRKNVAPLAGRPLITYILDAARAAIGRLHRRSSRLIVSTDDPEIAEISKKSGAEVPFLRPAELALDSSIDVDVLLHALDWLRDEEGFLPEILVELQATSPLTLPDDICDTVHVYEESGGDPVLSVTPDERPREWSCILEDGRVQFAKRPEETALRRQDAAPSYHLSGAISVISPDRLRRERTFLTRRTVGHVVPSERAVDIDTDIDLAIAEAVYLRGCASGRFLGRELEFAGRRIGPGRPCFVIAEAGVNHNGDPRMALRLVDAAADAGADAVKFQTFRAEALCAPETPKESYQLAGTGGGESQLQMLKALELPDTALHEVQQRARSRGLAFLSTPFDEASADVLEDLDVPAFKVGSGELTHFPLLRHIARKGRPVILSTGMSTLEEVAAAVDAVRSSGDPPLALLHCVSCYPAELTNCNLRVMATLRQCFGTPVGFSDHTLGFEAGLAAVSLGACVIEKHLTLDRGLPGPDHGASLDPAEFTRFVMALRAVESSLGDGVKEPMPEEEEGRRLGRRSLFAAADIAEGEEIRREMITVLRPGTGIPPREMDSWVGRKAPLDFGRGSPLREP